MDPASCRQLRQILGRHRSLLTGSEHNGLVDHADWILVETVAVAIGADDGLKSHDRFAPLADLVLAGIGRNLLRLGQSFAWEKFHGMKTGYERGIWLQRHSMG